VTNFGKWKLQNGGYQGNAVIIRAGSKKWQILEMEITERGIPGKRGDHPGRE